MAEYSRIAKGKTLSLGGNTPVVLPFVPDYVEFLNYTAADTPAENGIPFAKWDAIMGQGYAAYQVFNATPVLTTNVTTSGGISTFSAGLDLQYGSQIQISGITKASPAVVTTGSSHGYVTGDVVVFQGLYQSSTTGMPQICGIPFVITVTGATTFTIPWNTNQSNYTALSGSPTGAYVKKVLYPFLYAPGVSYITSITTGSTTVINTTAAHNLVVGQEVAFRVPSVWGTTQLNSLPNTTIPGSPVYGYVTAVGSSTQVTVNINSSSYTAFNSNQPVSSVPGQSFAQMLAVGDVNTGGVAYSGSVLYPSPSVNGSSTINGPAISGSFVNNTRQGFIIGATVAGAANDVLYWRAILHDYSNQ